MRKTVTFLLMLGVIWKNFLLECNTVHCGGNLPVLEQPPPAG